MHVDLRRTNDRTERTRNEIQIEQIFTPATHLLQIQHFASLSLSLSLSRHNCWEVKSMEGALGPENYVSGIGVSEWLCVCVSVCG